ncbi:MAG: aminotransferase class I/II-fold pyridoxal phosphate-dependent enzyme [Methanomassiliicoccales archaeon]
MNMQLETFKLERYFARYEFAVRHMLCASDCESMSIQELLSLEPEASASLGKVWLGYTEPSGAPTLREAIRPLYKTVEAGEILVHSGAEEAIFLFMHAALRPGDHIVVHSPCYQSLEAVATSIGCEVTHWKAREERGWSLDVDELSGLLRENTKVVVINTPHNPTGFLMSKADLRRICQITDEKGITLFSDEVYRGAEYDPKDRLSAACDLSRNAVSLGVMSKTYGLPGLRIGWIATHNKDVLSKMERLKDYTTICNSAPSEFLAELALRHGDSIAARNVGIIKHNLDLLDGFFERHSDRFQWVRPRAGPIAYPRLIDGNVDKFCEGLVNATGVLLLPGSVYDDEGGHFRIGFGRKNMPRALGRLEEHIDEEG